MTNTMIVLLITTSVLTYGFFGGIAMHVAKREEIKDEFGLFLVALFWPLVLPALGGLILTRYLTTPKPKPKAGYPPPVTSGGYRTDHDGG